MLSKILATLPCVRILAFCKVYERKLFNSIITEIKMVGSIAGPFLGRTQAKKDLDLPH